MLAQGRLRDAEHARNVRFGNAVGGHRLGLPPLRVSRGPNRSSHWKIRPLRSATIIALCDRVHLSARRLGWGAQKRSHRQQQLFQDGRAFPPGSAGRARRLAGDGKGLAWPLRGDVVEASTVAVEHRLLASKLGALRLRRKREGTGRNSTRGGRLRSWDEPTYSVGVASRRAIDDRQTRSG